MINEEGKRISVTGGVNFGRKGKLEIGDPVFCSQKCLYQWKQNDSSQSRETAGYDAQPHHGRRTPIYPVSHGIVTPKAE
jgi:hypothetical protein